jgi:signal transduction histidine kinase
MLGESTDKEQSKTLPLSSGIGLTIASTIINEIGGSNFEIKSTYGIGTLVSFTMDLETLP